ncbi:tyrosine-type recombinase/integrase [Paraburkholderia sp. JPY454]|uniref:Tyrosine-type recombinase/integrase n=1 Tax=Paraburkholderia youngii TaxID=2782701 RepID=A0ABX2P045_9BURK|nr:tyrosine-type recombinase/integrase [Paraburkholderia youngii]
MHDHDLLGPWVRRFLLEHLVAERNLSRNTQASYRDTLTLLLPFISREAKVPVDRLSVRHVSQTRVRAFMEHLERNRNCATVTRNQRLAAIHSLARFIGLRSPEHLDWCSQVRSIPFRKTTKTMIVYLDRSEMAAILHAPDCRTFLGTRDHALLLFLYNSGARANEAASLQIGHLEVGTSASVRILGKGNKWRICPLWPTTAATLRPLIAGRSMDAPVFLGRTGKPMTRFGVHRIVTAYAARAAQQMDSMRGKRISPHTIRHTTAVHLLRAGVDINTIRAWLGHVSVDTTNVYAEVDLEMKARALACLDFTDLPRPKSARWCLIQTCAGRCAWTGRMRVHQKTSVECQDMPTSSKRSPIRRTRSTTTSSRGVAAASIPPPSISCSRISCSQRSNSDRQDGLRLTLTERKPEHSLVFQARGRDEDVPGEYHQGPQLRLAKGRI